MSLIAFALAFWAALLCLAALGYSDTIKNRWLDYALRGVTPAALTSGGGSGVAGAFTIALYTGDPGASGAANEVTGGSYARQNGTFNAASGGSAALSADVSFTSMPAATVSHIGVFDKTGTPVFIGGFALTASKTVGAGDTFTLTAAGTSGTIT